MSVVWVSVGSGVSGRLVNVLRAGIAAVDGINPMVGAVIAVGMGIQEFVTYSMCLSDLPVWEPMFAVPVG